MANFSNTTPGADILAAYQKATRISPISEADKKKVLSDYGVAAGWSKGKSDTAISNTAADKVVAKFKKDQAKVAPKPTTPPKTPTTPTKPATGTPKPVSASSLSSVISKYGLPSTSKPPAYALVSQQELEAWAQRSVRHQLGYDNTVSAGVAAQIPSVLRTYGLPATSRPPTYALKNEAELQAWAARARRYMLYGY